MKLFELFERKQSGLDNLKTIAEAVKNKTSAKLKLGEQYIIVNNTTANCVYNLYENARMIGKVDRFMEELSKMSAPIMENTETLGHIINRFPKEVKDFNDGNDMDEELYHALFDYYNLHGEMPYGVAKARSGDPFEWVTIRFEDDLGSTDNIDVPVEEDLFGGENDIPELSSADMFESKKAPKGEKQVDEGWDDMIKASKERASQKQTGDKWKTRRGESEKTDTGIIHRRSYDPKTGEANDSDNDSAESGEKRGRGRPRTRPLADPSAPKRGRGRPRTKPEPDASAPKRGRGRPKKVREWIENLCYIAKGK